MWRCSFSAQERQVIAQACARKSPEELAESSLRFTHLPRDFMLVRRVPETAFRHLMVCMPGRRNGLLVADGNGHCRCLHLQRSTSCQDAFVLSLEAHPRTPTGRCGPYVVSFAD
jgi:hypothetical protein